MKITFIQARYENVWEALGLGYIISYVKEYCGEEHEIGFYQRKFDETNAVLAGCVDSDIVAISCTSPSYEDALFLARHIKIQNKNTHIVFGGWHPTALPNNVIKEDCIDQVIVGEGEMAMVKVVLGSRRPILQGGNTDTTDLPWPDRRAIKNERTVDLCESMNGKRTASFQLNRGCKVHCKFCSEQFMTGKYNKKTNPIRTRGYNDLLDEIDAVAYNYNLDYFKFVDATFDKDVHTVKAFCDAKINRRMMLPWEANIHPGFVQNEQLFHLLAEANCEQINVGCESGSPYILNDVGKGTSLSSIKNVFKWAKKYGIKRRAYFLLGMPNETKEDHLMTEDLIDSIEPDVVGFTILAPYPGSDFYYSLAHANVDWSLVDEYSNDIWFTKNFNNRQLKEIQQSFKEKYSHLLCERQA
jgi:radical SAM superfamily enzyme YgiQ (UPF0313 family)